MGPIRLMRPMGKWRHCLDSTVFAGHAGSRPGSTGRGIAAPVPRGTFVLMSKPTRKPRHRPEEIAVVGEVDDWESDVVKALLEVPAGRRGGFYTDPATRPRV